MIKYIVFDLGRVTLDFDHHTISGNLSKYSARGESVIFDFIFKTSGLEARFDKGLISPEEFAAVLTREFAMKISFELFARLWSEIFSVHPGIEEVLTALKPSYRLGLLSNTNKLHFEYAKKTFKMLGLFDDLYLSYELGAIKPDKTVFERVIDKSGVNAEEILFIDDIEANILAARSAGMNGIRFKGAGELKTELGTYGIKI